MANISKAFDHLRIAAIELRCAAKALKGTRGETPVAWLALLVGSIFNKEAEAVLQSYGPKNRELFEAHMHASKVRLDP